MDQLLFDVGVKGLVVLGLAAAAARMLEKGSAASRHLVWSIALASLAALPLLSTALPGWRLEVLPGAAAGAAVTAAPADPGVPWGRIVALAWLAGAAVVVVATAIGRLRVMWLARRSEPLESGPWPALATRISGELGLGRAVRLRRVDREIMPMVWGIVRPVVLLPESADAWEPSLKRHVLLHELAHVQRHDYAVQLVCRLALAIHWFDPLAWRAARRLRHERERACDDHVLGCGASACDYARDLVEMARRLGPARGSALALGVTGASSFADRVLALLDGGRPRRILTRRIALAGTTLAAGLVVPLAALHPTARTQPRPTTAAAAEWQPPPPGPTPAANARSAPETATPSPEAAGPARPAKRETPAKPETEPSGDTPERAAQIVHVDPIEVVIHGAVPPEGAGELNAKPGAPRLTVARTDRWSPTGPGETPDHRASAPTDSEACEDGEEDAPTRPAQLVSTKPAAGTP